MDDNSEGRGDGSGDRNGPRVISVSMSEEGARILEGIEKTLGVNRKVALNIFLLSMGEEYIERYKTTYWGIDKTKTPQPNAPIGTAPVVYAQQEQGGYEEPIDF